MSLRVSRCLPLFVFLVLFAAQLPVAAQSIPCSAITRNPQALEALLDSHSKEADADLQQDDIINAAQLERLQFIPIVIQPGDALYMEYRGRDFSLDADFASGERTAFDSSPKGSYEQWRKGILPLDMFREALSQRLIRLRATAKNPNQVLFRNIKIIRAGKPVFEFAKLASYGKMQVETVARKQLPCKGVDEYQNQATAFTQANLFSSANSLPKDPLTLTAQDINSMNVDYAPVIQAGDFMVFESNRRDFTLHLLLSNGKEIVSRPLTKEDVDDTSVAWRKGRIRLDYPEAINQRIIKQAVIPLHESVTPLLFRGIKVDGNREWIYELEKSQPGGPKPKPVEPPMSYPPDAHVMTASASAGNMWGRQPEAGFLAPKLPTFSMHPMMFQSTTDTSDPNHFKFTGAELDSESGLYHMGARYYSPGLGRFVQPDPLYITYARLNDPQQLNLYTYSRNNPTTFNDPTGLDYALNCKNQGNCTTAVNQLNGREHGQFKVALDKNNKLTAPNLTKAQIGKLSSAEKTLYNSIKDTNHTATLNIVNHSGSVTMGVHDKQGVNTVDVADTAKLNSPSNAGGLNAGDAVAHEAMQAYMSLTNDETSDTDASALFPGTNYVGSAINYNRAGTAAIGSDIKADVADGRGSEIISTQYRTPIPAVDIFTKGITRATTGVERDVTGVEFVPAKKP